MIKFNIIKVIGLVAMSALAGCIEQKTEYDSITVKGQNFTIVSSFTEDEFMDTVTNLRRHVIVNGSYVDCTKRACRDAINEELGKQEEKKKRAASSNRKTAESSQGD